MYRGTRVFPTQGAHSMIKTRLIAAQRSFILLNKKKDILVAQFKAVLIKLLEKRSKIQEVMREASISLARVKYITGNINEFVLQSANKATIKVLSRTSVIAGVNIPAYEIHEEGIDPFLYIGLAKGGQQVSKMKNNYRTALELLIKLASLQTSFIALLDNIKVTTRHVNVLRYIIIPLLKRTLKYIVTELEEQEREETSRLKKIQNIKRRQMLERYKEPKKCK